MKQPHKLEWDQPDILIVRFAMVGKKITNIYYR
jgi:hypothetical protein